MRALSLACSIAASVLVLLNSKNVVLGFAPVAPRSRRCRQATTKPLFSTFPNNDWYDEGDYLLKRRMERESSGSSNSMVTTALATLTGAALSAGLAFVASSSSSSTAPSVGVVFPPITQQATTIVRQTQQQQQEPVQEKRVMPVYQEQQDELGMQHNIDQSAGFFFE